MIGTKLAHYEITAHLGSGRYGRSLSGHRYKTRSQYFDQVPSRIL